MGGAVRDLLETRRLRYFRAVAESGSMSAAARRLNVAQPAISYHVAELEARIGARLLLRHGSGVSLTEEGAMVLRYANRVAELAEQAEAELRRALERTEPAVRLRLGVISSLAAARAPAIAAARARWLPGVVLRISESGTRDSLRLMEAGEIDAAVHLLPGGASAPPPLCHERLLLVSGPARPGAVVRPVRFADLARYALVLPARGNPLRDFLERIAEDLGVRLRVAVEIDGWAARRTAVLAGLGATVLGAHCLAGREAGPPLGMQPIVEPPLRRPIFLSFRRGLDPALAAGVRHLLEAEIGHRSVQDDGVEDPAAVPS